MALWRVCVRSESHLQGILDGVAEGILTLRQDGMIETFNGAAERMFGYPAQQQVGAHFAPLLAPSEADRVRADLRRSFSEPGAGRRGLQLDVIAVHRDGTLFPAELSVTRLRVDSGEIRFFAVFRNVSEHVQLEEERLARRAAETANRLKGELLAKMSHEFRTPLNAILGLTYLVLNTEMKAGQRDYLEKTQGAAQKLLSLVNDCLDFSEGDSGKLELQRVDMRLEEVLESLVAIVGTEARNKGLSLGVLVGQDVPQDLVGDPGRPGQVLSNLVGNAIKFTEKGEVRLTIRLVQAPDTSVELQFAVSDTGILLSLSQLEGLFSLFSQGDNSSTRKYGGTGLGLALCQKLVRLMDGELSAESQLGVGSKFRFTARFALARVQRPAASPARSKTQRSETQRSETQPEAPRLSKQERFSLQAALAELASLLKQSDGRAVSLLEQLLEQAAPGSLDSLARLVRTFDFEAALRELERLEQRL